MRVVIDSHAWISKDQLSTAALETLKGKLTVYPKQVGNYPGPPAEPVKLYVDLPTQFGIARQFFFSRQRAEHELVYRVSTGDTNNWDGDISFNGTLLEDQVPAVNALESSYNTGSLGGLLKAATGSGKTIMACNLICRLKVPTLVVVAKDMLLGQWLERINQFLPAAKVGFIQQDVCDIEGKHIVIAMMQTLTRRDYADKLKNSFGMVIFDEVHHVSSATFSQVPGKFNARFRLGLSATMKRADGCEEVFYSHIGPVIHESKVLRLTPKVRRVWTEFKLIKTEKLNPNQLTRSLVIRFLCASVARNKIIVDQILQAVKADRKILVLSERLNHLDKLANLLTETTKDMNPKPTFGFCVGGMDQETIKLNCAAQVLFATTQMVSEAFDHPPLDTLFLTTPVSNVTQSIGRILRTCPGKKEPVVVDFRDDNVMLCFRSAINRDKTYSKLIGP